MSRIRFKGITSASVPVPPAGKASLYYDDSDKSLKMRLDNGDIIALGVTEEYIRNIVADLVDNSDTIEAFYEPLTDSLTLNIKNSIISDTYVDKISPTKIVDAQNGRYETTLITNNATPTEIFALNCASDGCWLVELRLTARRLGGLAGSPGDGATFKRTFRVKSIGSSVTVHDIQSDYTSKDSPGINLFIYPNSTNAVVSVQGWPNNNVRWNADIIVNINS